MPCYNPDKIEYMKGRFFIYAAAILAALAVSVNVNAGSRGHARGGIMAGFTSSSSNARGVDANSIARYHFGLTAQLPIALGFALQPSVLYQAKGTTLKGVKEGNDFKLDTKVSYIEVPVQIQWGPDLVALRPYIFAEPFVGYGLFAKAKERQTAVETKSFGKAGLARWEYGLGLGAGVDVWKLQVSVKYFWNFGSLYSESGNLNDVGTTVKDAFKQGRNFNGISFSLAFMF